jgi:hypothetical protein
MLGATASLVLAGLGMAGNAVQAVKASKQQKQAQDAAKQAAANLRNIEETNYMAGLQTPDISKLEFDQQARNQAQTVQALQEMGPEGAAQASGVVGAANEAALRTSQQQALLESNTQQQILGAEQDIEKGRVRREGAIGLMELEGAQTAAADAQATKQQAIGGMVDMAGLGIQGADEMIGLYGNRKTGKAAEEFAGSLPNQWYPG